MACAEEPGHPRYKNGDPEDQAFNDGELLYRRYMLDHFKNKQLLPSAFRFPRQSFNRQKYSSPADVLHPECCEGKVLSGWGVLECSASDLPSPVEAEDGKLFHFAARHQPLECCYAHTEVWCYAPEGQVSEPSRKVKLTFRVKLAQKMTVCIQASI